MRCNGEVMGVVVQEARGVCGWNEVEWGEGRCGGGVWGSRGGSPWLARGPPKAGHAASLL